MKESDLVRIKIKGWGKVLGNANKKKEMMILLQKSLDSGPKLSDEKHIAF